jgi:CPA2 family monovalent cation:H+ antiporter-2
VRDLTVPLLAGGEADTTTALAVLGGTMLLLAILGRVSARSGISPIPLYLVAGLAIGYWADPQLPADVSSTAELIGVVLLLFMLGIEYSGHELVDGIRTGARAGAVDLVLNVSPGIALGLYLGWGIAGAVALGGATYISSSGIIAKVLEDLGRLGNRETPAIISVLVIEDLVMAFYLPILGVLITGAALATALGSVGLAVAAAILALLIAVRHGHRVSRLADHQHNEVLLLTVLGLLLLVAGLAERIGVSAAVGAFLVGIAISGSVAERTRELIAPLRDVFAAFFFVLFALSVDAGDLPSALPVALGLAVVTVATKLATGWYAARAFGVGRRGRLRAGVTLGTRGEFSIVIAGLAVTAGVTDDLGSLVAAYVLLLALAGPIATRLVR